MGQQDRLEINRADALWFWLAENHTRNAGVWLVTFKKSAGANYVSREEVLDAVIAYGWIDGRRMKHDDPDLTMQLISPRRHQVWAQTYKERAARLEAEGRMQPPGRAAISASKAQGTWDSLAHVDRLEIPDDLGAALKAGSADEWFDQAAPSYRRNVLRWIAQAKTAPTRTKRVAIVSEHAARGEKVPQY